MGGVTYPLTVAVAVTAARAGRRWRRRRRRRSCCTSCWRCRCMTAKPSRTLSMRRPRSATWSRPCPCPPQTGASSGLWCIIAWPSGPRQWLRNRLAAGAAPGRRRINNPRRQQLRHRLAIGAASGRRRITRGGSRSGQRTQPNLDSDSCRLLPTPAPLPRRGGGPLAHLRVQLPCSAQPSSAGSSQVDGGEGYNEGFGEGAAGGAGLPAGLPRLDKLKVRRFAFPCVRV